MSLGTQGPRTHGLPPAARGAALIGLLVVIGIVGLQVLDDSSPSRGDVTVTTLPGQTTLPGAATTLAPGTTARPATTKAATVTTKAAATATTKAATVTTVAAAKLKKVADTKVIVYNASGVNGVASNMSDKLKSVGYNVTDTGNLDPVRTGTTVACRAGLDAEAARLANDVGGGATASAFPANPPKGSDADDCIVILGKAA